VRRTQEIRDVTLNTLSTLVNALEARSSHFKAHSQNVAITAAGIARALGLSDAEVIAVRTAELLHDVGMIAVPDAVVNKPGDLDPDERRSIEEHCARGAEILGPMEHLGPAITYVLEHHERINGSGYPHGKRGDDISMGGQIVGLAEAWMALTEQRSYRSAMTKAEAMGTLVGTAGSWFSADLLKALRASES
jgi:putative nucleotidyltransferase with HDIG domain